MIKDVIKERNDLRTETIVDDIKSLNLFAKVYELQEAFEINNQSKILEDQMVKCISARRGIIVSWQERLSDESIRKPRNQYTLNDIMKLAIIKYGKRIKNRDKRKLKSPSNVHPSDPCNEFEEDYRWLGRYSSSLLEILTNPTGYNVEIDVKFKLIDILNEVNLCKRK
ncbi:hypothetical protein QO206_05715 [Leeuwenhoekiella aequorea]|uniref:hypothetical protein n=1 Tax=Leeuwenhoekiella aequorea TaxID=283736 RepID=UPI00352C7269|tara:strand:- start:15351 stop:15854 length:504 start_codon:yes stop_codon:yes gene_type:complete